MTGNEVKYLRGDLTAEQFARVIGCSERQIRRWEAMGDAFIRMSPAFERELIKLWSRKRKEERCD